MGPIEVARKAPCHPVRLEEMKVDPHGVKVVETVPLPQNLAAGAILDDRVTHDHLRLARRIWVGDAGIVVVDPPGICGHCDEGSSLCQVRLVVNGLDSVDRDRATSRVTVRTQPCDVFFFNVAKDIDDPGSLIGESHQYSAIWHRLNAGDALLRPIIPHDFAVLIQGNDQPELTLEVALTCRHQRAALKKVATYRNEGNARFDPRAFQLDSIDFWPTQANFRNRRRSKDQPVRQGHRCTSRAAQ